MSFHTVCRLVRRPLGLNAWAALPDSILGLSQRPVAQDNGRMFWFMWKKLCGSYLVLSS